MKTIVSESLQGLMKWCRTGFRGPIEQNLRLLNLVVKWYETPHRKRAVLERKLERTLKKPTLNITAPLGDAVEYDPSLQEAFYQALGKLAERHVHLFASEDIEQILRYLEQSASSAKPHHSDRRKIEQLVFVLRSLLREQPSWIIQEDRLAVVLLRSYYIPSEVDTRLMGLHLYNFVKEWPNLASSVLKKDGWRNIVNIPESILITAPLRDALEHNSSVPEEFCEALEKLAEQHTYLFTPEDAQTVMVCLENSANRHRPCKEGCLVSILLDLLKEHPNWAREVHPLDRLAAVLMHYYNTAGISGPIPCASRAIRAGRLYDLLKICPELAIPILQTENWLDIAIVSKILLGRASRIDELHKEKPTDFELFRALVETVVRISKISSIRFPDLSSFDDVRDYELDFLAYVDDDLSRFSYSIGDLFLFHRYHGLSEAWRLRYEVVKALRSVLSRFHTTENETLTLIVEQYTLDQALLRVLVAPHEWLGGLESIYDGRGKSFIDKVLGLDKEARYETYQVLLEVVTMLGLDRLLTLINCIEQVLESKRFATYDEMLNSGAQEMAKSGLVDELFQKQCADLLVDLLDHSLEQAEKLVGHLSRI